MKLRFHALPFRPCCVWGCRQQCKWQSPRRLPPLFPSIFFNGSSLSSHRQICLHQLGGTLVCTPAATVFCTTLVFEPLFVAGDQHTDYEALRNILGFLFRTPCCGPPQDESVPNDGRRCRHTQRQNRPPAPDPRDIQRVHYNCIKTRTQWHQIGKEQHQTAGPERVTVQPLRAGNGLSHSVQKALILSLLAHSPTTYSTAKTNPGSIHTPIWLLPGQGEQGWSDTISIFPTSFCSNPVLGRHQIRQQLCIITLSYTGTNHYNDRIGIKCRFLEVTHHLRFNLAGTAQDSLNSSWISGPWIETVIWDFQSVWRGSLAERLMFCTPRTSREHGKLSSLEVM